MREVTAFETDTAEDASRDASRDDNSILSKVLEPGACESSILDTRTSDDTRRYVDEKTTRSVETQDGIFWQVETGAEEVCCRIRRRREEDRRVVVHDELETRLDDRDSLSRSGWSEDDVGSLAACLLQDRTNSFGLSDV